MKSRKNLLSQRLLGSTVIVGALYIILFSGTPNFSNDDAEYLLSNFSTHLSEESGARGSEAKLQYSHIEVQGFAYDKWARISNFALDFMTPQWQGQSRLGLSTKNADLVPDHTSAKRATMRFPEAINLISGSQLLAILQPDKPIIYGINQQPTGDGEITHRIVIPTNLNISMLEPKRNLRIELTDPIQVDASFFKTQHRLRGHVVSGVARILSQGDQWGIENVDIRYDSLQKSTNIIESKGTLTLDRLTFARAGISTTPLAATAAWLMKEQRNINDSVESIKLEIEHGLITNGDSKISVTGDINFDIDDAAYGELVVEISNPTEFVKSGWIAKNKQEEALSLLDEILGEKIGSHKQAIINIVRTKNGEWKVGKVLLDEDLGKKIVNIFIFNTQEQI